MKNIKSIISFVIIFILIFDYARGVSNDSSFSSIKPIFYLGGYAGYNQNLHTAGFKKIPPCPNCSKGFTSGTGSGFSIGALFDYELKPDMFIEGRLGYSAIGAELFVHDQNIGNTPLSRNGNTEVVPASVDHTIDSKISIISLEPIFKIKFFESFIASIGLKAGYILTATMSQKEQLISPDNYTFKDGRLVQNDTSLNIPNSNSLQLFGMLGLGYELPIGKNTYLTPEIKYYLGFIDVAAVNWKPNHLQLGLSIKFPVYPHVEPPPQIKKIERIDTVKPLPKPKLTASVDAYGISADGKRQKTPTIVIEETETEEGFPLLPQIFFKEGSSDITSSGLRLLNKNQTNSFVEDSLNWDIMDIYSDLLNIVGYRMKQNPKEKITITGCNKNLGVETNNLDLSRKRAESVKEYLVNTWSIKPERIIIKERNLPENPGNNTITDGQIENQRAEIGSTGYEILKPVFLKEIERKSNPPIVEIEPNIQSEAALNDWEIKVEQSGNILRKYSQRDSSDSHRMTVTAPGKIVWEVEKEPIPELDSPVEIKLTAKDNIEQSADASISLNIEQLTIRKKRYELKEDKRIERFSLIVFDYDKSNIKPDHKKILEDIKQRIMPNSVVTIEGYADRTGEQNYNRELALRRSQEVQNILNVNNNNLKTNPIGSDILLYDNDSPQGRSYCRTVKIKIETPVKE
ncbi:MAG: OmpA family protein [Ignavibacteriae bacterium]|nr:OmpA family protein [Ignavibacteriota bacterium]